MNKKGGSIGITIGIIVVIIVLLVLYALTTDKSTIGGGDEPIIPTSVTTVERVVTTLVSEPDTDLPEGFDDLNAEQQQSSIELRNVKTVEDCARVKLKDDCYIIIASEMQDPTICENIELDYYKEICLRDAG